jgi:hypothetical protein
MTDVGSLERLAVHADFGELSLAGHSQLWGRQITPWPIQPESLPPQTMMEPLETRIAPASLTLTDVDGDKVVITVSKGSLELGGNVTVNGNQITLIDLNDSAFANANLKIVATRSDEGGDGFVNIGQITGGTHDLGKVSVDGDLGRIICGDGEAGSPALKSLTVQSLGRLGTSTGATDLVSTIAGAVPKIVIKGDLVGAQIVIPKTEDTDNVGSITVAGSIIGGDLPNAGFVQVSGGDIGTLRVGHDIVGGAGENSANIFAGGSIQHVIVGGDLRAQSDESGLNSAFIGAESEIGTVKIRGSIVGSNGSGTGTIFASNIGSATIGGGVYGGSGLESGTIRATTSIGSIQIHGDLRGLGDSSGSIRVPSGLLKSVTIGGDIAGGTNVDSGQINADTIGSIKVAGSIYGSFATRSGWISASHSIGTILIGGNLSGAPGVPVAITAAHNDQATDTVDLVIKSIKIGGRVEFARILGGFDSSGTAVNLHAQIGSINVGGAWVASSVSAGLASVNGFFGDADDAPPGVNGSATPISRIASIVIGGAIQGTTQMGDHFGFVAQEIAKFKVNGIALPLTPGPGNDDPLADDPLFLLATTGDVRLREFAV